MTRAEQYHQRDKLQAEKRKNNGDRDPEESEPVGKKAKAAHTRQKQQTKAAEKKEKAKAKAMAKKQKAKEKKEAKMAKAKAKAAAKKAKKAEKAESKKETKKTRLPSQRPERDPTLLPGMKMQNLKKPYLWLRMFLLALLVRPAPMQLAMMRLLQEQLMPPALRPTMGMMVARRPLPGDSDLKKMDLLLDLMPSGTPGTSILLGEWALPLLWRPAGIKH